jgi:heme exporter protein B
MWHTVSTIFWKDLKIELRTKEAFSASFVFAVLVLVIFSFALNLSNDEALRLGAGILWIAFAFAGVLSLNRSFALEKEESCAHGLVLAPVDRAAIYLGKFFVNVVFMLVTEIFILPLFAIFFNVDIGAKLWLLVLILILGSAGFASIGTLFSAMAVHTRMREVMLPILLLPTTVPIIIASVKTTAYALGAGEEASFWFTTLIVYDIVSVTLCFLMFEHVLQE